MAIVDKKLFISDSKQRISIGSAIDVWTSLPSRQIETFEEALDVAVRIRSVNMMYEALALALLALDGKWSHTDAKKYIIDALELANDSSETLNYQEFQILTEDAIKNLLY